MDGWMENEGGDGRIKSKVNENEWKRNTNYNCEIESSRVSRIVTLSFSASIFCDCDPNTSTNADTVRLNVVISNNNNNKRQHARCCGFNLENDEQNTITSRSMARNTSSTHHSDNTIYVNDKQTKHVNVTVNEVCRLLCQRLGLLECIRIQQTNSYTCT